MEYLYFTYSVYTLSAFLNDNINIHMQALKRWLPIGVTALVVGISLGTSPLAFAQYSEGDDSVENQDEHMRESEKKQRENEYEQQKKQDELKRESIKKQAEGNDDGMMKNKVLAASSEWRKEKKQDAEEHRAEIGLKQGEIAQKRAEYFLSRFSRAQQRISGLIHNLASAGVDTTKVESSYEELKKKADGIKTAFSSLDEALQGSNKMAIQSARKNVVLAKNTFREYYVKTFRPTLKSAVDELRKQKQAASASSER